MRDRHSSSPSSSSSGSSSRSASKKPRRRISGSDGARKSPKKDDKPKRRSGGGQSPKRPPSPDRKGSSTSKAKKREASSAERRKKGKKAKVSKEKVASLLGKYDGKSCLDAFLNKFNNCTKYGEWNEVDRQFYLTTALEGAAAQVLRDTQNSIADSASIILLLQDRFGTKNQSERFRAELHARRRKPGESLQEL